VWKDLDPNAHLSTAQLKEKHWGDLTLNSILYSLIVYRLYSNVHYGSTVHYGSGGSLWFTMGCILMVSDSFSVVTDTDLYGMLLVLLYRRIPLNRANFWSLGIKVHLLTAACNCAISSCSCLFGASFSRVALVVHRVYQIWHWNALDLLARVVGRFRALAL
jgi:hypothetical protein